MRQRLAAKQTVTVTSKRSEMRLKRLSCDRCPFPGPSLSFYATQCTIAKLPRSFEALGSDFDDLSKKPMEASSESFQSVWHTSLGHFRDPDI
jgi:hypothetical protein